MTNTVHTASDFQAWFLVYWASISSGSFLDNSTRGSRSALVREPRKKPLLSFLFHGHLAASLQTGPWQNFQVLWMNSHSSAQLDEHQGLWMRSQTKASRVCAQAKRSRNRYALYILRCPCQSSVEYGSSKITQDALNVQESLKCWSWTLCRKRRQILSE